ncbi:T9SS type A sorting domain-containing protein [Paraflavitalea speifideaquila]|uniref:T9SS type A sorting domain-containing protein n=1 Tax=Paraflavitalea speifideaquila TaxID=3076558 RepID=UPI0028E37D7A|nr:T9SS type A sorting domain-containing protein [Paraflavitalea speifideiaquila]
MVICSGPLNRNGQVDKVVLITANGRGGESNGKDKGKGMIGEEMGSRDGELAVMVSPVPSYYDFTVHLQQGHPNEAVRMRVFDQAGRMIEGREGLRIGARITLGSGYGKGFYLLEVVQGSNRKTVKLVKL